MKIKLFIALLFCIAFTGESCKEEEGLSDTYKHPEFIGNWTVIERGEFFKNDILEFTSVRFFKFELSDDEHGKCISPNGQGEFDFLYSYIESQEKIIISPLSDNQFCVREDTYSLLEKESDYMLWKTVFTAITSTGDHTELVSKWELTK